MSCEPLFKNFSNSSSIYRAVFQQIDIEDATENGGGPTLRMFGVTQVSFVRFFL